MYGKDYPIRTAKAIILFPNTNNQFGEKVPQELEALEMFNVL